MKTILVTASYSPSLVNFRGPLIVALRGRGHQVHACAPGLLDDTSTREKLERGGVVCHDVPLSRTGLSPVKDLRALFSLVGLMRRVRPDVYLGYTIKPVIWGLLAARMAGVPKRVALITGLGYAFSGKASGRRGVVQRIARALYAKALRAAHLVFFQNPDDKADFERFGLLQSTTPIKIVNGSGVDIDHFAATRFPEGGTKFLLIARLLGDKGIREYVAAAQRLKAQWPQAEFHLVGGLDPNPEGISRAEVTGWADAGHIIWHGPLDDVRAAIEQSHVYVLPSYREGTPRTVLEAMAMGRPIVTTDAPGCRETVEDGLNGFLVEPRDVDTLVSAMQRFLADPDLVVEMGAASRRIAEEKYDVNKVNASMIEAMDL